MQWACCNLGLAALDGGGEDENDDDDDDSDRLASSKLNLLRADKDRIKNDL